MALLSHWEAFLVFLAVVMAVLGAIGSGMAFAKGVEHTDATRRGGGEVDRRATGFMLFYLFVFSISISAILTFVRFVW